MEKVYLVDLSRADSLPRFFWPAREEINYWKRTLKNILKSKIFWGGIGIFLLDLISDILVRDFLPYSYHPTSPLFTLLGLLLIIRALLFLRFKTWWRSNKFLDIGFSFSLGAILARIKDFKGSMDWILISFLGKAWVTNLMDIFAFLGFLFLLVGIIICPKRKFKNLTKLIFF